MGGRQIFSNKVCTDGKLPVSPVHQNGQHDPGGPSEVNEEIHGRPDRSSCKEDIVDKNNLLAVDGERKMALAKKWKRLPAGEIVPVQSDVESPRRRTNPFKGFDKVGEPSGERLPSLENPDKIEPRRPLISLKNFVGHATQDPVDPRGIEKHAGGVGYGHGSPPFPALRRGLIRERDRSITPGEDEEKNEGRHFEDMGGE